MATVVYTVVTAFIWYTTRQNTIATRQVLEASHRPYVGVTLVHVEEMLSSYADLCATIQNVGTVPSRNVEIELQISFDGSPKKTSTLKNVALLPNQAHVLCCGIGAEEVKFLNSPHKAEAAVEIRYQGMTDKQYRTKTRSTYTGVSKPFSVVYASME